MKQMIRTLAVLGCLLAVGAAQTTHIVNLTGTSFVGVTSGTNTITIAIGDSVQFVRLNGTHTATNGTSLSDPALGTLFNFNLNSTTTTATYTPTAPGTIPFFCSPHFFFGMTGTIIVLPSPIYPGSGEAFNQGTAINTPGGPINPITFGGGFDVKTAVAGDVLSIRAISTSGAFNFTPLLIVGQFFATGGPAPVGALPNLYVNTFGAFIIVNGTDPSAFGGFQVVAPGGSTFAFNIPVSVAGQSCILQSLALSPFAANGFFALSDGHEIRFL